MNERELFELQEEVAQYKYFVLKNGSRTTSYRVPSAKVGNIENYIKQHLKYTQKELKYIKYLLRNILPFNV